MGGFSTLSSQRVLQVGTHIPWIGSENSVKFFSSSLTSAQPACLFPQKGLSKKGTGFISNHAGIVVSLSKFQRNGLHNHVRLENGLPDKAKVFPEELVRGIAYGISKPPKFENHALATDVLSEGEADSEEESEGKPLETQPLPAPQTPRPVVAQKPEGISRQQREILHRLHANTGHLPRQQMLMMLKAAGAKDAVLKYAQEQFECEQCHRQRKPITHKQVSFPRTFSFNHVVGIDFYFISFKEKTHAFINVICQGTNFQQVAWLKNYEGGPPSSKEAWRLFEQTWIRVLLGFLLS